MTALRKTVYAEADDLKLLRGFAARDPETVRLLTERHNQRLFRAAWSILKDRAQSEDAVQSGYLNAFAAIAGFDGRSSLSTWLTRIVINEALATQRKANRRRAHLDKAGVLAMDDYRDKLMRGSQPAAPDAELAREQLRWLLEKAIAGLPDAFRTVFVLREVEALTVEETAEALGLPVNTVKTRLLRARRKLREALTPEVHGALLGTFPFAGADCEAMTQRVLDALSGESTDRRS